MSAHVANDGMTFLLPGGSRAEPRRGGVLAGRVRGALRWVAEMPRRRAVLEELTRLSDRELADIGMTRGDLPRVFDPAFAASRNLARRAGC
ncbi:MAG: DUF1127 domain-containing protein [Rhodospirillales bacterium]|nr:DUF1127 domain-containing protein [Rhodospirillales bacterium]